MMPVNLNTMYLPPSIRGLVSVNSYGTPRFWATVWSDVLKTSLSASTRRKHLSAIDRLYQAVHRQRGKYFPIFDTL
ncbi:cell division septal protein FtsQ [Rhizobium sp. BIGb0125]|nr:cell division septal protein FtsQ [Rhizobium sp. BIGb0125]